MLGPGRDGSAGARFREPQALVVFFRQRHGGVKADDRELAGDVQDRLDDRLAHLGLQVVELGGIVPRHAGAVVAVVDEPLAAGPFIDPFEDHSGVGCVV